jgi:hypothetical protein
MPKLRFRSRLRNPTQVRSRNRLTCQRFVLGSVLIGDSPYRAVVEMLRDLFGWAIRLGTVHIIDHRLNAVLDENELEKAPRGLASRANHSLIVRGEAIPGVGRGCWGQVVWPVPRRLRLPRAVRYP